MIDDLLTISECGCESVKMNSFINQQIELRNLTLNAKKCHQLHIGNPKMHCPKLNAHKKEITKVKFVKINNYFFNNLS